MSQNIATVTAPKKVKVYPTSGLVHFKPIHKQVFGDSYISGTARIKNDDGTIKEIKYKGSRRLITNGLGFILNMANEGHRELMKVYDHLAAHLYKKGDNRQRFEKVDIEQKAEDYLATDEAVTVLKTQIYALKGKQLKSIGLFFKITGSDNVIKSEMIKMALDPVKRPKLQSMLYHPDRKLIEFIHVALTQGSKADESGLYQNENGLYLFNKIPLGIDLNAVVAYLKGEGEQNKQVYQLVKQVHDSVKDEK